MLSGVEVGVGLLKRSESNVLRDFAMVLEHGERIATTAAAKRGNLDWELAVTERALLIGILGSDRTFNASRLDRARIVRVELNVDGELQVEIVDGFVYSFKALRQFATPLAPKALDALRAWRHAHGAAIVEHVLAVWPTGRMAFRLWRLPDTPPEIAEIPDARLGLTDANVESYRAVGRALGVRLGVEPPMVSLVQDVPDGIVWSPPMSELEAFATTSSRQR